MLLNGIDFALNLFMIIQALFILIAFPVSHVMAGARTDYCVKDNFRDYSCANQVIQAVEDGNVSKAHEDLWKLKENSSPESLDELMKDMGRIFFYSNDKVSAGNTESFMEIMVQEFSVEQYKTFKSGYEANKVENEVLYSKNDNDAYGSVKEALKNSEILPEDQALLLVDGLIENVIPLESFESFIKGYSPELRTKMLNSALTRALFSYNHFEEGEAEIVFSALYNLGGDVMGEGFDFDICQALNNVDERMWDSHGLTYKEHVESYEEFIGEVKRYSQDKDKVDNYLCDGETLQDLIDSTLSHLKNQFEIEKAQTLEYVRKKEQERLKLLSQQKSFSEEDYDVEYRLIGIDKKFLFVAIYKGQQCSESFVEKNLQNFYKMLLKKSNPGTFTADFGNEKCIIRYSTVR